MATTDIDLQFLQRQQQKLLEEMMLVRQESQATRAEARQVRGGFTEIGEQLNRLDRRIGELRDDYNTMLKLELGGSLANLETRLEIRSDALETRIGGVEGKVGEVESRLGRVEGKVGEVENRLGRVEGKLGEVDSRLGRVESGIGAILEELRQLPR